MDQIAESGLGVDVVEYSKSRKCRVFRGTNVPVLYLWNAIMDNETVQDFVRDNPGVSEAMAMNVVRAGARHTDGLR